jgi:hypothetical protein
MLKEPLPTLRRTPHFSNGSTLRRLGKSLPWYSAMAGYPNNRSNRDPNLILLLYNPEQC